MNDKKKGRLVYIAVSMVTTCLGVLGILGVIHYGSKLFKS